MMSQSTLFFSGKELSLWALPPLPAHFHISRKISVYRCLSWVTAPYIPPLPPRQWKTRILSGEGSGRWRIGHPWAGGAPAIKGTSAELGDGFPSPGIQISLLRFSVSLSSLWRFGYFFFSWTERTRSIVITVFYHLFLFSGFCVARCIVNTTNKCLCPQITANKQSTRYNYTSYKTPVPLTPSTTSPLRMSGSPPTLSSSSPSL